MLDTRQPQLEMPRFEGDTFNRRHTGVGWEMGFPSCQLWRFQFSTSPPSLSSQVRMISGFCAQIEFLPSKNKIPFFFFLQSYKSHLQNGAAFQSRKGDFLSGSVSSLISDTFSQAASVPLSYRFHSQNKLLCPTTTHILRV